MVGAVRFGRETDGDVRQALRASQERYRSLVDRIPLGVVVFGQDFRIVEWNPAAARVFGWTAEEVLGREASFLLPPEVGPVVGQVWREVLEGRGGDLSVNDNLTRDGRRIVCEWRNTRVVADDGSTVLVSSTVEDVTDPRRAEDALLRSEARFRAVIDAAPDIVGVTSDEGRYLYVNPAFVRHLGHASAAAIVGRPVSDFVHEGDRALLDAPGPKELRLLRADGAIVACDVTSIPIDFDGRAAILSMARDVTERRRLQATLLQSDRMASLGILAAGLAHEIHNPLAYVKANLDVLAGRGLPQLLTRARALEESLGEDAASYQLAARVEQIEQMIELVREGAERMQSLVNDLKTFSRADDAPAMAVDVARILDSTLKMAWSTIRLRARVVKSYGAIPPIRANESRLGQVFLNVLVNAAQAIPDGNPAEHLVHVRTASDGDDAVLVEVSDSGCGIPEAALERIFDPFYTTKPVGVGTGLGLFISQGIVAALGGQIRVTSRVGAGTTVSIRLPLGAGAPACAATATRFDQAPGRATD